MRPITEQIPTHTGQSFTYRWFDLPRFPFDWHMHRELELTWIVQGHGRRYVGDHVESFSPGDLALLGSQLPHTWYSQHQSKSNRARSVSVVIQFPPELFEQAAGDLPELAAVRRLLERSASGLAFGGPIARKVGVRMQAMQTMSPLIRLTAFLEILDMLTRCRRVRALASNSFVDQTNERDRYRMDRLHEYLHRHYDQPITLADAAKITALNTTSFARFFRRSMGQSFVQYLHRLRIAHACRQLSETDRPITDICYLSGFGNISNFNRVFQSVKHCTPREYRRQFQDVGHDADAGALQRRRIRQSHRCTIERFPSDR